MTRIAFLLAGLTCALIGFAGVLLPLIPGTPFLLLSAFCFARSSPCLHSWPLFHPKIGRTIKDGERNGSIATRTKWIVTISVITAFAISFAIVRTLPTAIGSLLLLSCALFYIWSRPLSGKTS